MRNWVEVVKLHSAAHTASCGQPKHGLVTSVDPVNHAVKVMVEPDGVESGWIPDSVIAAGGLRIACPSEVGTQVLLLPVEGDAEHPVVVGRLFDTVTRPPLSPATSRPVQPGEIGIFLPGGSYLHMTDSALYLGGSVIVVGSLSATEDVTAGGISVREHLHSQVQPGSGVSGPPRS